MTSKAWITVLALGAVSGVGFARYGVGREGPHLRFATTPVKRGSIAARVSASGTLSALVTVQIGSQVSGRIQELLVDFNSKVKKGQVLARIDRQLFEAALASARANRAAATGSLAKARANAGNAARRLERSQTLAGRKLIAGADLEQGEADAESAQAEVAAAQGNLEQTAAAMRQAEINLTYATILSPIDGVVISRTVDVGQVVAASLLAPTLFTIAGDLAKMQVDTSIVEADVGKLQAGMSATFTVDAYPAVLFRGIVREIRNAPQTVQNVVTYDAVLDVTNADLKLKPGMTAHVAFVYAQRHDVLEVANAALRFRPPPQLAAGWTDPRDAARDVADEMQAKQVTNDRRVVWVLRAGKAQPIPVRVGLSDGLSTELVEGSVRDGDRVVVEAFGASDTAPRVSRPRLF